MASIWDYLAKAGLAALAMNALWACGGGGGGANTNPPRLRYLNGSPDSAPLTFKLDSDNRVTGVTYPGVSPNIDSVMQDGYDFAVAEDGDNPDLDSAAFGIVNEHEYLVGAVGLKNFGDEFFKRLRLVVYDVNLTPPNGNRSRIYAINGFVRAVGFDTPAVDLRNPVENPTYKIENIAFGGIGTAEIDSSTQTFEARRNGSTTVYATGTGTFEPGGVYVAMIAGIEGGVGTQAPRIEFLRIN